MKMSEKTKNTACGAEKPQHDGCQIWNQKKTKFPGFNTPLQLKTSLHLNLHLKRYWSTWRRSKIKRFFFFFFFFPEFWMETDNGFITTGVACTSKIHSRLRSSLMALSTKADSWIADSLFFAKKKVEEFEAAVICSRAKLCQERSEIRQDLSKTGVIYAIYLKPK